MEEVKINLAGASPATEKTHKKPWFRYLILLAILLVLTVSFFAYRTWSTRQVVTTKLSTPLISQSTLEEQYGLRVWLIGVTAAGGLIDFRLKILDEEKAKQLLEDPARTPSLWIEASDTTLMAPQDMRQNIKLEDGGIVFFLLPNTGNAVKPGTPVTVLFGDLRLEPIIAQ